jgi:hypothetical protein
MALAVWSRSRVGGSTVTLPTASPASVSSLWHHRPGWKKLPELSCHVLNRYEIIIIIYYYQLNMVACSKNPLISSTLACVEYILVDNPCTMLRYFKIPFDRATHISCSIININLNMDEI